MNSREFSEGDEPAIRKSVGPNNKIDGWPCPFCGAPTLLQSDSDLVVDTERVEVYCDNTYCEAREIVVLIRRGGSTTKRSDVRALRTVDRGTEAEQEADGYTIERDQHGKVIGTSVGAGTPLDKLIGPGSAERKLARRRRDAEISIVPRDESR